MSFTMLLVCSQNGAPRKLIHVNEEHLKREDPHVDGMNKAFATKFTPFSTQPVDYEKLKKMPFQFD